MKHLSVLLGALSYEFRMQLRRVAVWATFGALGLVFTQFHQPWNWPITTPAGDALIYWTTEMHSILALALGILLADRLVRDRSTKMEELLNTFSAPIHLRLVGKYLGSTLATLLPVVAIYAIGVSYILFRWHTIQALPLAFAAFGAIVLPGTLFVGAFSLACPVIIWMPLYQFLFVGYWFWGNLLPGFGIPTLSETILTPIGSFMCTGFFNPTGREGVCNPGIQGATATQGVESVLLLFAIAAFVMLVLPLYLQWQQARQ